MFVTSERPFKLYHDLSTEINPDHFTGEKSWSVQSTLHQRWTICSPTHCSYSTIQDVLICLKGYRRWKESLSSRRDPSKRLMDGTCVIQWEEKATRDGWRRCGWMTMLSPILGTDMYLRDQVEEQTSLQDIVPIVGKLPLRLLMSSTKNRDHSLSSSCWMPIHKNLVN